MDEPLDRLRPGATIGHFRIVRELGRGGFGVVHLAEDLDIPGRVVALKSLHADRGASAPALRNEAAALAALQHPHILVVHEVGEAPSGIVYLVEEHMAGGSLADRLRRGPLPLHEALAIGRASADALSCAHDRGIVHRDFKPANLLFTADGVVKVADFGIALRAGGQAVPSAPRRPQEHDSATITLPPDGGRGVAGTPLYVPPELFAGGFATARGDQFSYGVTLHELLAGGNPFDAKAGLGATLGDPTIAASIPSDVRGIIARCLARDPARRHPDMRAIVAALDAARARRSPERRRTRRVAAAFAVTLAVLAGAWGTWRVLRAERARALNESGRAALERGDRDAARAAFVAAHAADPEHLPACTNLGTLAGLESNPAWAVTLLRDCASRFPGSGVVHYNLGAALRATDKLDEAERELRRALELAGATELRAPVANELALLLLAAKRPRDAVALLSREHADAQRSVEGAVLAKTLGIALLDAGDPGEALVQLRAALEGALPSSLRAEARVSEGLALERLGRRADAAEAFARSIAEGAEGESATRARDGLARVQSALQ